MVRKKRFRRARTVPEVTDEADSGLKRLVARWDAITAQLIDRLDAMAAEERRERTE